MATGGGDRVTVEQPAQRGGGGLGREGDALQIGRDVGIDGNEGAARRAGDARRARQGADARRLGAEQEPLVARRLGIAREAHRRGAHAGRRRGRRARRRRGAARS